MKYLKKYNTEAEREAATSYEPGSCIVEESEGVYYDREWTVPTQVVHENKSPYWTWDWKFIRPAEWPNLDIFDIEHNYCIVMTYDCRDRKANPSVNNDHFFIRTQSALTIERGNVVNGQFVVNDTISMPTANTNYSELLPTTEGDYVVYKITPTNPTDWFRCFFNGDSSWLGTDNDKSMSTNKILEIQCNVPGFNAAFYPWGSESLRRLLIYNYQAKPFYLYAFNNHSIEHIEFRNGWYVSAIVNGCFQHSYIRDFDFDNITLTAEVKDLTNLFAYCRRLETIHFGNIPNIKPTSLNSTFRDCGVLRSIDAESITIGSCTHCGYTFSGCESLESLNLSTWTFAACATMGYMFNMCRKLKTITFSNSLDLSLVTSLNYTFYQCVSIVNHPFSGKTINLSSCTNFQQTFSYCCHLSEMDMSNWTCSMTAGNTTQMFEYCAALNKVVFPTGVTGMNNNILRYCYNLKTIIMNPTTPPTWAITTSIAASWNPDYKIYVPDASVATYKGTTGWSNIADHIFSINDLT